MYFNNQKLIFQNKEKETSYYIAGFNSRSDFNNAKLRIWWDRGILLEGKVYKGFFTKEFNFSTFSLWQVYKEIGEPNYSFEQFKKDLMIDLTNPKYCLIYAQRPPRKFKPRTKEEIEQDTMIAASCVNTAAFT